MGGLVKKTRNGGAGDAAKGQADGRKAGTAESRSGKPRGPRQKHPRALLTLDPEFGRRVAGAPSGKSKAGSKTGPRVSQQDKIIGSRIRAVRLARGLTQSDVGKSLGITFQQIQKYEMGTNRVSAVTLVSLAQFLGVSPDVLLQDLGPSVAAPTPLAPTSMEAFGEEALLRDLFRQLSDPKWRRRVLEFLELLTVAERNPGRRAESAASGA